MKDDPHQSRAADMVTRIGALYRIEAATAGVSTEPRHTFTCQRCGGSWTQQRTEPLSSCPLCGYARWSETPEVRTCARCGYVWTVPNGHPHGKCPNCRSRLWDTTPNSTDLTGDGTTHATADFSIMRNGTATA